MECQFSVEKVKGQGHGRKKNNLALCLITSGGSGADDSGDVCKLTLTIVRSNLLTTPGCSETGLAATYHVGTRRHTFLVTYTNIFILTVTSVVCVVQRSSPSVIGDVSIFVTAVSALSIRRKFATQCLQLAA